MANRIDKSTTAEGNYGKILLDEVSNRLPVLSVSV